MINKAMLLTIVALAGIVVAGCGSSSNSQSGTTASAADDHEQGVKFAECLRENGVPDFPDPDSKGDYSYGVSVPVEVWRAAVDACKDLKPPGALSSKRTPEEQDASLQFAQCVRENGVPDFPDPVNGEPLINTYEIPSSNRPGGMTILNAAIAKCDVEKAAGSQP